jgi:excisionase family DNA binding protein
MENRQPSKEEMNMNDKASISPLLLTAKEASAVLSISERKLWELTNRREVPCIRIGRAVRYSLADLSKWIEHMKAALPTRAGRDQDAKQTTLP